MSDALRAPLAADVEHVVSLVGRHWPEPVDENFVRLRWDSPRVSVEQDARVGDDVYVLVDSFGEERVYIDLHGSPVPAAFDWAESRAVELGGARALAGGWSTERAKLEELERRGYTLVRRSRRMEIDLRSAIPPPVWPEEIELRTIRPGEERAVYEVQQETFRDTWEPIDESFEDWSHILLQPPRYVPELWFLAADGPEIAGFALCHPYPAAPDLGWVAVLGVRRGWRRRGLGRALLLHAFGAFQERGLVRAGLGVDSESPTGAHALYEQAGMRTVSRFEIYEKPLQ